MQRRHIAIGDSGDRSHGRGDTTGPGGARCAVVDIATIGSAHRAVAVRHQQHKPTETNDITDQDLADVTDYEDAMRERRTSMCRNTSDRCDEGDADTHAKSRSSGSEGGLASGKKAESKR